jgi:NhaP-type Na+/H+ or K+/H+ antiporter
LGDIGGESEGGKKGERKGKGVRGKTGYLKSYSSLFRVKIDMSDDKDLLKLFIESGWMVSIIGAAGMLARLISSPLKRANWTDYLRKIIVASITSTIAWFVVEQMDISSITKAITYGVVGVVSPELIDALINLSKSISKNPSKFIKR